MVPRVLRRNSSSSIPSAWLNRRIGGIVASPTPMMPISGDSMTRMPTPPGMRRRPRMAAAIQPAVPPPTMAISRTRLLDGSRINLRRRGRAMRFDELRVRSHRLHALADHGAHAQQRGPRLVGTKNVRQRIVVPWQAVLANEQGQPAVLQKVLLIEHGDP